MTSKPVAKQAKMSNNVGDGLPAMDLEGDLQDDPIAQCMLGRSKNGDFNGVMTEANVKKLKVPLFKVQKLQIKGTITFDFVSKTKPQAEEDKKSFNQSTKSTPVKNLTSSKKTGSVKKPMGKNGFELDGDI
jgi:hypothetical protein